MLIGMLIDIVIDCNHFTFQLNRDDITNELSLLVTEEIEDLEERDEIISLWNYQINELKKAIGA